MQLTLGFSPCPNDTFIFDAMIHGKVDTEGLSFDVRLGDVEALNRDAFEGKLAITKLSYHTYAYLIDQYILLDAGSALGKNCGPLLIAKKPLDLETLENAIVAIPGKYTTANFLLSLAYPGIVQKKELLFSDIEHAVLDETVTAGLIIHENRFTYMDKGLVKIRDLGEFWEETTQLPIPLGGIAIQRNLDNDLQQKVNRVLTRSVQYARQHPEQTLPYVRQHAQEMEDDVMMQHIHLYVNDFTENLGKKGRQAVKQMFEMAWRKGVVSKNDRKLFLRMRR